MPFLFPMPKNSYLNSLFNTLQLSESAFKEQFLDLFIALEENAQAFSVVLDLSGPHYFRYVSPSVMNVLGFPPAKFLGDYEFNFLKEITAKKFLPYIAKTQAQYIKEAQEPGFNFILPQIVEFNYDLIHASGNKIEVSQLLVVLNYSGKGLLGTLLGTYQNVSGQTASQRKTRKEEVIKILKRIKKFYVAEFPEKFESLVGRKESLIPLYFPKEPDMIKPTEREKEILQWIANGLSTKEIAEYGNISFHTAESYRKDLLKKFKAKNSAELIKKASKLFWLD